MADFNQDIPEEYLNSEFDFGFTVVDAEELGQEQQTTQQISETVADDISSELLDQLASKSDLDSINSKLATLLQSSDPSDDDYQQQDYSSDLARLEEKVDKVLAMENQELLTAVSEQGENIRAIIDEVEERKGELNKQYEEKMQAVEKLTLPLLYNLMKNPSKEYILWPNRTEALKSQIQKILSVTRG